MNKNMKKKKPGVKELNTYRVDYDLRVVTEAERFPAGISARAFAMRVQAEVSTWADVKSCEVTWTATEQVGGKDDESELKPHKYERGRDQDGGWCLDCGFDMDDDIHQVDDEEDEDLDNLEEVRDQLQDAQADIRRLKGILSELNKDYSFRWVRTKDRENPEVKHGDWVRFYFGGVLKIGQVEYVRDLGVGSTVIETDAGGVNLESVLEVRSMKVSI